MRTFEKPSPDLQRNPATDSIICRSCGADYSPELSHCPYCGSMNLPAAESAYMEKLEAVRQDLEALGGESGRMARQSMKILRRKIFVGILILAVVLTGIFAVHQRKARSEAEAGREEYLWQRENFPRMDGYYSSGEYDALAAFYSDAAETGHRVYNYEHRAFCEYLLDLKVAELSLQEQEQSGDVLLWLFRDELTLYRLEGITELNADERERLTELRAPLLEDFETRFPLSEEELERFRNQLERDGYLPAQDCETFLQEKGWLE